MAAQKKNGTQELIGTLKSQTKQEKGFGFMWSESTHAVGTAFSAVGNLADAGNQLAIAAKRNAVMSNLESSKDICDMLGIEAEGIETVLAAESIVDYLCSRR